MESTRLAAERGEPLGSERLGALVPLPSTGDSGPAFAREVERAAARARGDGLAARRHEALAHERRAQRRAGFEGEPARVPEEGPRATPAAAPAPAPVRAEAARPAPLAAPAGEPAAGSTTGSCASCAPASVSETPALASTAPPDAPAAPAVAAAAAGQARAAQGAPPASEARAAAPSLEAPPPLARPVASGTRAPATAAAPAEGPESAPLARAEAILEQIRLHAAPGVRRLTLELEPADLGRLSIQLALRSGRVTAIVRAEDARTLELLERRSDELHALLDARGVRTDSLTFALGFATPRTRRSDAPAGAVAETPDPVRASGPGLDTLA